MPKRETGKLREPRKRVRPRARVTQVDECASRWQEQVKCLLALQKVVVGVVVVVVGAVLCLCD